MRTLSIALVGLIWLVMSASAQVVATLADLPVRLNIGDGVTVEDRAGASVKGTVLRLTPEEIVVTAKGAERVFLSPSVRRIQRRGDSPRNGKLIGAVFGGALGGAFAGAFSGESRASDFMQGVAISGSVGLGRGLVVDAAHVGTTTVFSALSTSAMMWQRGGDGVAVRATWAWQVPAASLWPGSAGVRPIPRLRGRCRRAC